MHGKHDHLSFDGGPQIQAAYGTSREDTRSVCGKANTGFGLLFNWNLLGNGVHTIRALADGVQFASATFTVTTLGTEFLRGASGRFTLQNFPRTGASVTVQWQESTQNFVIERVEGSGVSVPNVAGTWSILFTSLLSNTCPIPAPAIVGGTDTLRLNQSGASISGTASGERLFFSGTVQPDGSFEMVGSPPETRTVSDCTFSITPLLSGNFLTERVEFTLDVDFSPGCPFSDCGIVYAGTIRRVTSSASAQSAQALEGAEDLSMFLEEAGAVLQELIESEK
jgi:hypothetical protein